MTYAAVAARAVALLLLATTAAAQDPTRARPAPPEQLGAVHFQTSCSPAVAAPFDRAVALLHSFEFGASIQAFNTVLAADSTCAMAQWGIALSRWTNPMAPGARSPAQLQAGRAAADAAARLGTNVTEREREYIVAVSQLYANYERVDHQTRVAAYADAMADLVAKQPADTEAKIFYAIALSASASPTDKSYAKQLKAGAILESLWVAQPNHPGLAHYIIHTYDYPALADRAAAAARRYSEIAPSAAHALHMPSHTFTRLGSWNASAATNLRSIDAALRSGSIGEVLHASDYLEYAYLQTNQLAAAKAIVDGLPALAARYDVNVISGAAPPSAGVYALAAIPARYALERRDWAQAASLVPAASAFPWTEAMVYFARALGASHTGDLASARTSIDSLRSIQRRLSTSERYWAEQVAIQQLGAQAWLEHAEHRDDAAVAHLREAATREDATEKSVVAPGSLVPAHELFGDLLMELHRPGNALVEYRASLRGEPNRYRSLDGARRAAAASGDHRAATTYATQFKRIVGA